MKPLINTLILMAFIMPLPGIIGAAGTPEERRRAATVSALSRDQTFPPQLLRLIASNGHITRDCEELEMGFFPQNEWKALKRVFKRNERTAAIRHVIDQYDDARDAWRKSPMINDRDRDGQPCWWKHEWGNDTLFITIQSETGVSRMILNEDHEIIELFLPSLNGKDIGDLFYLPPNLKKLDIGDRDLPNFEFHKLPRGLKVLVHPGPDAESKLHVQSLPPRLETFRLREYGDRRKEDPLEVHFYLPLPQGLTVHVPRMEELVYHPEPSEINEIERDMWEVKWDDGSRIRVIVR